MVFYSSLVAVVFIFAILVNGLWMQNHPVRCREQVVEYLTGEVARIRRVGSPPRRNDRRQIKWKRVGYIVYDLFFDGRRELIDCPEWAELSWWAECDGVAGSHEFREFLRHLDQEILRSCGIPDNVVRSERERFHS